MTPVMPVPLLVIAATQQHQIAHSVSTIISTMAVVFVFPVQVISGA